MTEVVFPQLVFASPRKLPRASALTGRVVVLDVAFAADGMGTPFATTKKWIDELGGRLAAWIDHHDHDHHIDFAGDSRFVLARKAEHGACPEMITPERVRSAGPIDTIVCHIDLDGLYAAAKWILGGEEPYPGADQDANVIDTRIGTPSARASKVDRALRARSRDDTLKFQIVRWLVSRCRDKNLQISIDEAADEFAAMENEALRLAGQYQIRGHVAYVQLPDPRLREYDKTLLLMEGQKRAPVSIVHEAGMLTVAAPFDSQWNFVELLSLGGGMPTRVSIGEKRLDEVLEKVNTQGLT